MFGSAYQIAVVIVSPNMLDHSGTKRPEESEDQTVPQIKVDNATFCYPSKKDVQVLKGVTIDIEKNKIIALVGHSGCGKSSII